MCETEVSVTIGRKPIGNRLDAAKTTNTAEHGPTPWTCQFNGPVSFDNVIRMAEQLAPHDHPAFSITLQFLSHSRCTLPSLASVLRTYYFFPIARIAQG